MQVIPPRPEYSHAIFNNNVVNEQTKRRDGEVSLGNALNLYMRQLLLQTEAVSAAFCLNSSCLNTNVL